MPGTVSGRSGRLPPMTDGSGPVPGITLLEEIGHGGFATVYRAHQHSVDRLVAVKIDNRRLVDPTDRRRFVREATSAGRLSSHPNILTLYDCGTTDDGRPYLVMEYCPDGSYWSICARHGPRPTQEVADVGAAIADALAAAHAQGILHRDIKPANLLLNQYGSVLLSDFGLATLPRGEPGHSVTLEALTPDYAPPEAFHYVEPSAAADIYSLGCTLYALLCGRAPRADSSGRSPSIPVLLAQHPMPLAPVGVPGSSALMDVIWRATAYEPAQRFASAADLRDALRSVSAGGPAPVPAPAPASGAGPVPAISPAIAQTDWTTGPGVQPSPAAVVPGQRRALTVGLVGLAVLLVAGVGWWGLRRSAGAGTNTAAPSAASNQAVAPVVSGTASAPTARSSTAASAPTTRGATARPSPRATRATPASSPPPRTRTTTAGGGGGGGGAQCYAGLVNISGIQTARGAPCAEPHYWEVYARGILSATTASVDLDVVMADPRVAATCSAAALQRYLGGASPGGFDREVLPPTEASFAAGSKGFTCLAARSGAGEVTGSLRQG